MRVIIKQERQYPRKKFEAPQVGRNVAHVNRWKRARAEDRRENDTKWQRPHHRKHIGHFKLLKSFHKFLLGAWNFYFNPFLSGFMTQCYLAWNYFSESFFSLLISGLYYPCCPQTLEVEFEYQTLFVIRLHVLFLINVTILKMIAFPTH